MNDQPLTESSLRRRIKRKFNRSDQQFFLPCAPGVEPILATEVQQVLETAANSSAIEQTAGGVLVHGHLYTLYPLNLHLRTANRVLLRIADFWADSLPALFSHASRVQWETYLGFRESVAVRTASVRSRLATGDTLETTLVAAINARLESMRAPVRLDSAAGAVGPTLHVRIARDRVTLSIDTSGDHLYKRGYRIEGAKAPLRPTLAAALLAYSGWPVDAELIDPFCGSGTIPIEAALAKMGRPVNAMREFDFQGLPFHNPSLWERLRSRTPEPVEVGRILAVDVDPDAVRAAIRNAEAAGVDGYIDFHVLDSRKLRVEDLGSAGHGWIVSNIPYGKRIDVGASPGAFTRQTLNAFRTNFGGWHATLLVPRSTIRWNEWLSESRSLRTVNGGMPVEFIDGKLNQDENA